PRRCSGSSFRSSPASPDDTDSPTNRKTLMIEVTSLTKRYGDRAAVQAVSFTCAPGTVTGFLGPNGAGKSTTLKMLCGLAHPTSGRSSVLGRPYAKLPNPGRHVGVLIDASA